MPPLSRPKRISFKLAYKQRETRTINNFFNLGNMWDCSWVSYVTDDEDSPDGTTGLSATLVLPGGGERTYIPDNSSKEFFSHTVLERNIDASTNLTGFVLSYADGSKDYYGFVQSSNVMVMGVKMAFLTARADPFGHTNWFVYQETNSTVLLRYVIDTDGRTNTISYANGSFPLQITSVQDPFGRTTTLAYSSSGMLTNVTDVASLSSSFKYESQGWVTNLITPYGTTTFLYTTNSDVNAGTNEFADPTIPDQNFIIRSAMIVDPVGGTNLYVLRQASWYAYNPVYNTDDADFVPYNYPPNVSPAPPNVVPTHSLDNTVLYYRDSFHWGPRQANALPADLTKLTVPDYLKARMRHWLHDTNDSPLISQQLSMEQDPSPDGVVPGQTTWFDYDGKQFAPFYSGSDSQPSLIARMLPDGTTWFKWFQRDDWGRATNIMETYSSGYGATPLTRSNIFVYDPVNNIDLIQVIGPQGETLAGYAYDAYHNVIRMTNAVGEVTSYTCDAAGRLTSIQTPAGLTTTYIYFTTGTNLNYLEQTIDVQINRTNSYRYANDLVQSHTDELGLIATYLYDNLQRLTNASDSRGSISYAYDKLDLVKVTDRMGFTNTFGYDANRRRIAATNALGNRTLYNYCACGSLDSIEDATSTNFTYFYYNNADWLTNTTYADGTTVANNFDLMGRVTNTVDNAGHSVTNWFNNQGLNYAVSNAFGQLMAIGFDIEDRAGTNTDANGVTTTTTFDNLRRPISRAYPDGGIEQFFYTVRGLVAYTNQLNEPTLYGYDAARRKTVETNANLEITRYAYDPASDLLTLTDGKSQVTSWNYDLYGRVTNKVDATSTVILAYEYDADNRLTNRWSIAKGNTGYGYDPVGNLLTITYPVSPSVTFSYDVLNRLTNMVDGLGTTRYTYTAVSQLLSEDGPWSDDTITYGYFAQQRTSLSLQQPTGSWTNGFVYDDAKRLTNVTSPAGTFSYAYDALRSTLPAALTLPNTSYITNVYDLSARLLSTTLNNSAGATLDAAMYGYNTANQRTTFTNAAGTDVAYAYDPIGQLKVAASSMSTENRGYAYDAAWNVNHVTNNGVNTTFSVNNLNELTNEASHTFSYDGNGNLTNRIFTFHGTASITNLYDDENRLIWVSTGSIGTTATLTTFVYDGLGRLREQLQWTGAAPSSPQPSGGVDTNIWTLVGGIAYIYDGNRVIQERDLNNNPTVSYTRGNDLSGTLERAGGIGGLLARSDGYSSGFFSDHNFYHADGNGNITYLVNSSQTLAASYRYDPFGNLISSSGTMANTNTYRFSSKEFIPAVGCYYYLYRFYDPTLQRWMNRDPLGERGFEMFRSRKVPIEGNRLQRYIELLIDPNNYSFVHNRPVNAMDFLGLFDGETLHSDPLGSGANQPGGTWYCNRHNNQGCPPGTYSHTLADDYGGTWACITHYLTSTIGGFAGGALSTGVYGTAGGVVGSGALTELGAGAGTIVGTGGGILLGVGVAVAIASAACNTPFCH